MATYLEIWDWRQRAYPHRGEPVFVRYGRWDGRARSSNHCTGERELGVSVYRGRLVDGAVELDDCIDLYYFAELSGRIAFPVTGDEVGTGSDGEPVLRRVRLLDLPLRLTVRIPSR